MEISIRQLKKSDAAMISESFTKIGWHKSVSQYQKYYVQQCEGSRIVLVAFVGSEFAGYVTIVWQSKYSYFKKHSIPEIMDLNVLPQFRRKKIATKLMDKAEAIVIQRSHVVGIGVGLSPGYNAALRMYVLRGYVPDGKGVAYKDGYVKEGQTIIADDDLILHLIKELK